MAGRESEILRGYIQGVSAIFGLVSSGEIAKLDKTNILEYARELIEKKRIELNEPR